MAVHLEGADRSTGVSSRLRPSLDGLGLWWILTLLSTSGFRSGSGPWIQPLLYFAPGVLLFRLDRIRVAAPIRVRQLLGGCLVTGIAAWAIAFLHGLSGAERSFDPWSGALELVAFVLFCLGMRRLAQELGAQPVVPMWDRPIALTAIVAVPTALGTLLSVANVRFGDPSDPSGQSGAAIVVLLVLGLLAVWVAALVVARNALRATREWMDTTPTAATSLPIGAPPGSSLPSRTILLLLAAAVLVAGAVWYSQRSAAGSEVAAAEAVFIAHYVEPLEARSMQVDVVRTCHRPVSGAVWQLTTELHVIADPTMVANTLERALHRVVRDGPARFHTQQEPDPEGGWNASIERADSGTSVTASFRDVAADESAVGWLQRCRP